MVHALPLLNIVIISIGLDDLHVCMYKSVRLIRSRQEAIESVLSTGWRPDKLHRRHRQWRDITQWYSTEFVYNLHVVYLRVWLS